MSLRQRYDDLVERATRKTFPFWERRGLHVTPVHYYQPLPDTRTIPDDLWPDPAVLHGIDLHEDEQLMLLRELAKWREDYAALPSTPGDGGRGRAPAPHGPVDAEVQHAMLRTLRPSRVIQVGSDSANLLAAAALRQNERAGDGAAQLVVIDPDPSAAVRQAEGAVLLCSRVQDVAVDVFDDLTSGDVLFLDTSHVLRIAGDVQHLYLEVLPRLAAGVVVHLHGIFLPYEYPRALFDHDRQFWTEQYLLQALLSFNEGLRVRWASHLMHRHHPDLLCEAFPSFRPELDLPSSFWMVRTGHSVTN